MNQRNTNLKKLKSNKGREKKEMNTIQTNNNTHTSYIECGTLQGRFKKPSMLSLTPCFSGVFERAKSYLTVLTVFPRPATSKPVPHATQGTQQFARWLNHNKLS